MSKRRNVRPVTFTADEWRQHQTEDDELRRQNHLLRTSLTDLHEKVRELETRLATQELEKDRRPPPPSWAKANVEKPPEGEAKKRGAKFGHAAHHRPPPPIVHETVDVTTPECPECGEDLGEPFAFDDHLVEAIIPGHVRVTRYRIGRYRCRTCKRVRRARLAPDIVPGTSRFSWGTHFLVGYWSLKGMTNSMIRDLLLSDYGLTLSVGVVDKILRRSAELFAPAYELLRLALKAGKQVNVDWTGWRVDGINHHLWDFISPDVKAAFFTVARSAGHKVPERVLGKRRPKAQVLNCDGATAFNALRGRKERCWVHFLRKAKDAQKGWEGPSDAPDWRGLRVAEKICRRVLEVAKWPEGAERISEARRLKAWTRRWLRVERDGPEARALRKFWTKHWGELWWWAEAGVDAHNNIAEQGLRPHIAVKRKLSWGSRTNKGADRTALLASVIQTGKMQGLSLRELGTKVLQGQTNPFQFGPGPPAPA